MLALTATQTAMDLARQASRVTAKPLDQNGGGAAYQTYNVVGRTHSTQRPLSRTEERRPSSEEMSSGRVAMVQVSIVIQASRGVQMLAGSNRLGMLLGGLCSDETVSTWKEDWIWKSGLKVGGGKPGQSHGEKDCWETHLLKLKQNLSQRRISW